MSELKKITDIFYQVGGDGIPSFYCVQWFENGFACYEYFNTRKEANDFAMSQDCDEGLL